MNMELMEALNILEKEKNISRDTMLEAIEQSLLLACKNHFGKADNVVVNINPETCDFRVYAEKTVVEQEEDPMLEISLSNAQKLSRKAELGDIIQVEIKSKELGRIATQNAKNVILQKIREEERKAVFDLYYSKEKDVVTGIVQRYFGKNVSINLGKADATLTEGEQVKGEHFHPTERIKVYIVSVKNATKGPRILVSRTHPELVKRLFEEEVTEVKEGIVEIKSIAREAGSRSKIAVWSNDPDVDAVGACVGMNGARVNAIVEELRGEKIDIINWSDNPALLIENALSPAKVIAVLADPDEKTAMVVVPDYQLSLAIGKEGQNARLAAHLTGFKIDIKSESQAKETGEFYEYMDYDGEDEYEDGQEDFYGEDTEELYSEDEPGIDADESGEGLDGESPQEPGEEVYGKLPEGMSSEGRDVAEAEIADFESIEPGDGEADDDEGSKDEEPENEESEYEGFEEEGSEGEDFEEEEESLEGEDSEEEEEDPEGKDSEGEEEGPEGGDPEEEGECPKDEDPEEGEEGSEGEESEEDGVDPEDEDPEKEEESPEGEESEEDGVDPEDEDPEEEEESPEGEGSEEEGGDPEGEDPAEEEESPEGEDSEGEEDDLEDGDFEYGDFEDDEAEDYYDKDPESDLMDLAMMDLEEV